MKKQLSILLAAALLPVLANAQGAIDAFQLSQQDLRGTARYMSMAGAFGALGGDMSTLIQNPAGIGVYRSSDACATLGINFQSTKADYGSKYSNTVASCNTAGYVGVYKLNSEVMPNFNWGFSYNRQLSLNRRTRGGFGSMRTSLSNYIAGVTNSGGYTDQEIVSGGYYGNAPWLSVLAYDSYMITPNSQGVDFQGLLGDGTTGAAEFETIESGGIDEFSFNFGGNIMNSVYWGVGIGITDINYNAYTYYGESLDNAYVGDDDGTITNGYADYGLENQLRTTGTGWNCKFGIIAKPINELRFGLAFHSPTYYELTDTYVAGTSFAYGNGIQGNASTNEGVASETYYKLRTPWKFIASAAAVLGKQAIVSFDYQYTGYNNMSLSDSHGFEYTDSNNDIDKYYCPGNTYRVGLEYRATPKLSLRAGYSYEDCAVNEDVLNNRVDIFTSGTIPSYNFVKKTQYVTCGLGYKFSGAYIDFAYVYRNRDNEFHAFSPVNYSGGVEPSPTASVSDNNHQLVVTLGVRF